MGAKFTQAKTGGFHLTREGGHSHQRIVHAADATGAEIERALLTQIAQHDNIAMFEHHLATDFITDEVCMLVCGFELLESVSVHSGVHCCWGDAEVQQQKLGFTSDRMPIQSAAEPS